MTSALDEGGGGEDGKDWMMLDGIWEIKSRGCGFGLHIWGIGEKEVSLKLLWVSGLDDCIGE